MFLGLIEHICDEVPWCWITFIFSMTLIRENAEINREYIGFSSDRLAALVLQRLRLPF